MDQKYLERGQVSRSLSVSEAVLSLSVDQMGDAVPVRNNMHVLRKKCKKANVILLIIPCHSYFKCSFLFCKSCTIFSVINESGYHNLWTQFYFCFAEV